MATDIDDGEDGEEKCCVCNDWQPVELRQCQSTVFVSWAKCDFCEHLDPFEVLLRCSVIEDQCYFQVPSLHCRVSISIDP